MSYEEEVQLKDLITQTLESNGSLAKITAQLRSSVYSVLSEDEKMSDLQPLMNNKIKSSLETMEGKIMFCIVREFLEFFNLDCTLSVYESESYLGKVYQYEGRRSVAEELGLDDVGDSNSHIPLLLMLIRFIQLRKNESRNQVNESIPDGNKSYNIDGLKSSKRILNSTFELSNPTINWGVTNHDSSDNSYLNLNQSESYQREESSLNKNSDKIQDDEVTFQPIVKDLRSDEKSKSDKSKCKSNLHEVSPLQNNKSRVSDILPSLYNKEYKDKSGLRELDKLFDMEAEYEEDFMNSSDLSLKYDHLKSDSNITSSLHSETELDEISCNEELSKISSNKSNSGKDTSNTIKE